MLITDVRYFKPQVITAIFHANDIIAEHEAVTKLRQLDMVVAKQVVIEFRYQCVPYIKQHIHLYDIGKSTKCMSIISFFVKNNV